ncbi:MAG: helix-turn-helix domain-containing protein [Oscillospiraceae bacterium]|nr:helix-turn-helix domain-containing protein [Oscillospiraceae bacterium]
MNDKFSQCLKEIRVDKNIAQKEIAECLGIYTNAYQLYEYGKRKPSFEIFVKICEYFNVSSDYILGFSDIKERR